MELGLIMLLVLVGLASGFIVTWLSQRSMMHELQTRQQLWHERQEATRRYLETRVQEFYQRQQDPHNINLA